MVKIYTDANVLRYFGSAFTETSLPKDLQDRLLLAPLSVLELISHLGTQGADEAFSAVRAFPKFHNPLATGILPWPDDFLRICIFGLPPTGSSVTDSLNQAILNILNSEGAQALSEDGKEVFESLSRAKDEAMCRFSDVLDCLRTEGQLQESEHRAIFANSIARRARVPDTDVDVDKIQKSLDAYYIFEKLRMKVGVNSKGYNLQKHANDVFDAELLIYLADPSLHLLTCDRGFGRVTGSAQSSRVHISDEACLRGAQCATATIMNIVESAEAA